MRRNNCLNTSSFLSYSTRIVFFLLVLISASQITCTVIFMLMCRQSSRNLVLTLDLSVDPCKGQSIPAYIAFLILLVTIFGFGCVGRKATSVILFLLAIFAVATSTYLEILDSNQDFSQIVLDVNQTAVLCTGYSFNNSQTNISNPLYDSFKTCDKIYTILDETCKDISYDPHAFENFLLIQNCSTVVIDILKEIKYRYHHISLPLTLVSSIMYMVLSILLFIVQFNHKRHPGYRRREHILHKPEFIECPMSEDSDQDTDTKNWTLKLCLLNLLWCQCNVIFGNCYCCGLRRQRKKHDIYEFEALPTRPNHEDQMASITNLV